jgi:hypothetical protein
MPKAVILPKDKCRKLFDNCRAFDHAITVSIVSNVVSHLTKWTIFASVQTYPSYLAEEEFLQLLFAPADLTLQGASVSESARGAFLKNSCIGT